MTIKSWLETDANAIFLTLIICMVIAAIFGIIHFNITLPNQACNQCGYGSAIDSNPFNLIRDYIQVQCANEEIIEYKITRDIRDKWGNLATETGFWVTCGGNK